MSAMQPLRDEAHVLINAAPDKVFDYLDDHRNLAAHMSGSSWMMAGARMTLALDEGRGRHVGSRIRLSGRFIEQTHR